MLQNTPSEQGLAEHHHHQNVSEVDRWISGVLGASMLLGGLRRGGIIGLAKAGIGAAFLYRGVTGHCNIQENLDKNILHRRDHHPRSQGFAAPADTMAATAKKPNVIRHPSHEPPDKVQEASEESFPASDPPSWGPDRV